MKTVFIYSTICLALLTSCKSKELTREQAKEAILQKIKFPTYEKGDFEAVFYNVSAHLDVPQFEKLQQAGYITYNLDGWWRTAQITEQGKQYVLGPSEDRGYGRTYIPVKTSVFEFGEVTGIQNFPDQNMTEVTYTVKRTTTPFGKYLFGETDGYLDRKAIFRKFDDGWRMDNSRNQ